jgi:hypothetical protein
MRVGWRLVVCVALALLAVAPGGVPRAQAHADDLVSGLLFAAHGDPLLAGYPHVRWLECRPHDRCRPRGRSTDLYPGPTPAGTRFQAVAADGSYVLTRAWKGLVTAVAPPALAGSPRVGGVVWTRPGRWRGGWDGDYDAFELAACRTARGTGCETLNAPSPLGHADQPARARISRWYAGWYVQALEQRIAGDTVFDLQIVAAPPLHRGPTVSASPPVRIPGRRSRCRA